MTLNNDIICLHCKGCGDVEINTTFSSDADRTTTKTTHLEGIWCDKRQDKVEPRFSCPCYEDDTPDLEEEDEPAYTTSLVFFQADSETCRRVQEIARQNNISEGELITRLLNMAYPEEK